MDITAKFRWKPNPCYVGPYSHYWSSQSEKAKTADKIVERSFSDWADGLWWQNKRANLNTDRIIWRWAEQDNGVASNNSQGSGDMLNNCSVLSNNSRMTCWCRPRPFHKMICNCPPIETGREFMCCWKVGVRSGESLIIESWNRGGEGLRRGPWGFLSTHEADVVGSLVPSHSSPAGTLSHSNGAISPGLPRVNTRCIPIGDTISNLWTAPTINTKQHKTDKNYLQFWKLAYLSVTIVIFLKSTTHKTELLRHLWQNFSSIGPLVVSSACSRR